MRKQLLRKHSKLYGKIDEAVRLYRAGWSYHQLAKKYGIHHSNVMRTLKPLGLNSRSQKEGIALCVKQGRWPDKRGPKNPSWKGGRTKHSKGYVLILCPGHKRADCRGYVPEHVLVAEQMLGRPLKKNERVHHKNKKRDDNRPENLQVMTVREHQQLHGLEGARKRWANE